MLAFSGMISAFVDVWSRVAYAFQERVESVANEHGIGKLARVRLSRRQDAKNLRCELVRKVTPFRHERSQTQA